MLYFLSEPERDDNYFRMYNQSLRGELKRRRIEYREISLANPFDAQVRMLNTINSHPHDAWILSYAHNPIIRWIARKPGRKYGHAHGLEASLFEPAILEGYDLHEEEVFGMYDAIFVNSSWARNLVLDQYPRLTAEVVVSGFPFDARSLHLMCHLPKIKRLVAFNQRFSLDKLHILEVHLAEQLTAEGFQVIHLCSRNHINHIMTDQDARALYRQGQMRGLRFVINNTKADYYVNLSRAQVCITTSAADTLSVGTLEAAAMGVIPLAPDWGPFPEYLPRTNLYPPYNIDRILELVGDPPESELDFGKYDPTQVFDVYFRTLGGS